MSGDREEEARATLKRLDEQSEKIVTGARSDEKAAADDRIEILGKRIARILSVILAVGLIIYLWRLHLAA